MKIKNTFFLTNISMSLRNFLQCIVEISMCFKKKCVFNFHLIYRHFELLWL